MPLFQAIQVLKSQDVAIKGVHFCYNEQVVQRFRMFMTIYTLVDSEEMLSENTFTCIHPTLTYPDATSTSGSSYLMALYELLLLYHCYCVHLWDTSVWIAAVP